MFFCISLFSYFSYISTNSEPKLDYSHPMRITYIQESPTQVRFFLQTSSKQNILGIYYKPKLVKNNNRITRVIGQILSIKTKKKTLQLTLQTGSSKSLIIIKKADLPFTPNKLKLKQYIAGETSKTGSIKLLDKTKKNHKKLIAQGITYRGNIKSLTITTKQKTLLTQKIIKSLDIASFQVGDFIKITPKKEWKLAKPFIHPKYLFAQNISHYGSLSTIEKTPITPYKTLIESTNSRLMDLYKTSQYPSFYWSVLLAKKPLDKSIYRLFQKNELVHLLVISGSHIEIIISFFMFIISCIFISLFILKNPLQAFAYIKDIRFFQVRARSLPIFLVLIGVLIFYMLLTGSQQAGGRAIIGFIVAGVLYQLGIRISAFLLLGLSISFCFIFYPQWIAYPLGLVYSSTAVLSLYLCLPLIFKIQKSIPAPYIIKIGIISIITSSLVSLFIAPLSFYFFRYYNFISIFTNIPMGLLFFIFIYLASFASLIGLVYSPAGSFVLKISDICIDGMLEFLKLTENISWLKIYIPSTINPVALILFYIGVIICIQKIKEYLQVKEMKI